MSSPTIDYKARRNYARGKEIYELWGSLLTAEITDNGAVRIATLPTGASG